MPAVNITAFSLTLPALICTPPPGHFRHAFFDGWQKLQVELVLTDSITVLLHSHNVHVALCDEQGRVGCWPVLPLDLIETEAVRMKFCHSV